MRYTNLKSSVIDTINDSINMLYSKKIAEFELSVRTSNCLRNDNIITIGDLVRKTESEMLRTPNFGRKSLNEIKEILAEMSLSLNMNMGEYILENVLWQLLNMNKPTPIDDYLTHIYPNYGISSTTGTPNVVSNVRAAIVYLKSKHTEKIKTFEDLLKIDQDIMLTLPRIGPKSYRYLRQSVKEFAQLNKIPYISKWA